MTPEVTVSQSSTVVLASGAINRAGDVLTIELHRPADNPAFVLLRWPPSPTVCNSHPQVILAPGPRDFWEVAAAAGSACVGLVWEPRSRETAER